MKHLGRGGFLKGAFGLMATASLPAAGREDGAGDAFSRRGPFERLTLAFAHVNIGARRPFSVLHISDTHLTAAYSDEDVARSGVAAKRTIHFGGRQEEALRDSLEWAKLNVDFVLHTGDVIDWQSRANLDLVRKYYGKSVFGTMGNHEFYLGMSADAQGCVESYKERSWRVLGDSFPVDARFDSKLVNGVNFICLDNAFGTVQPDQVERFRKEAAKGLPIVLCMHVPVMTPEIWRARCRYWQGCNTKFTSDVPLEPSDDFARQRNDRTTCEFYDYLKGEALLKGIFAGHLHFMAEEQFSPTARQYVVGGNYLFCGREILFT